MSLPPLQNPYDWDAHARPNQKIPPGSWRIWLILAGRGFGKTRTGAETVRHWIESGTYRRIALLGQTEHDVRSVMLEGESGLLFVCPPEKDRKPHYQPSKRQIIWPQGATAQTYGADHYDKLRGPQFDAAWVDELAKFRYASQAWDQLMFGLRLGDHPRVIITTTPRPIPLIQNLIKRPDVVVTRGSTYENAANLSSHFLDEMRTRYEGTALGKQEIHAHIVDSTQHTLWSRDMIMQCKWRHGDIPTLHTVVISIDPSVSAHGDETGIIVVGRDHHNRGFVLGDFSMRGTPAQWSQQAIKLYHHHKAHLLVAEVNQGGDLIEQMLRTSAPDIQFKAVRAVKNKFQRAEPIAALYRQNRIFHTTSMPALEEQMCTFHGDSSWSPDRLDALIWGLTALFEVPPAPQHQLWTINT